MKLSLLILAMAAGLTASAQSLDLGSRVEMRRHASGIEVSRDRSAASPLRKTQKNKSADELAYAFVRVDNNGRQALEELGATFYAQRGGISMISIPYSALDQAAATPGVQRLQLSRTLTPQLDEARRLTGIDRIHKGEDLPRAYTGRGVVAGLVDGGMDPNHINFKDTTGTSRVKHLSFIRTNDAGTQMLTSTYTAADISSFKTDDAESYHGTHTMGIMAGGYRGKVKVGRVNTNPFGKPTLEEIDNPYYGAAPDANIAASCGPLKDMFIAYGIEGILNYAWAERKPAVINLSLGSNLGPHDGRGMLSQYLELVSKEAIVCISAGNEGDMPLALNKKFTENDTTLQSFIYPYYYGPSEKNIRYGSIQIYSDTDQPFELQAVVYNKSRGRVAERIPISGNTDGVPLYYVSDKGYAQGTEDVVSATFAKAFDGYVGVGSMIDPETGRYYAIIDFMTMDNQTSNADGNYLLGFIVKGKAGQRVDCFSDGQMTYFKGYGIDGWSDGSLNGTISDLGTTKGCIVVGSYDSRDNWTSLDGNMYGYDGMFVPGTISEFSSFGTIIDGRNLPHICAPGATIISTTNSHFVSNPNIAITPAYLQAQVQDGDNKHSWEQMVGTSMASPLVAGAIATWLEADPTLTSAKVLDIIQRTAVVDEQVRTTGDPVQWGAGKFDAYAGLKEVIRTAGLDKVSVSEHAPMVAALGGGRYNVFAPGKDGYSLAVYDTAGRSVQASTVSGDECTVDLSAVATGIYFIKIDGLQAAKIVVK